MLRCSRPAPSVATTYALLIPSPSRAAEPSVAEYVIRTDPPDGKVSATIHSNFRLSAGSGNCTPSLRPLFAAKTNAIGRLSINFTLKSGEFCPTFRTVTAYVTMSPISAIRLSLVFVTSIAGASTSRIAASMKNVPGESCGTADLPEYVTSATSNSKLPLERLSNTKTPRSSEDPNAGSERPSLPGFVLV